ncbi:MAG: hypothetical protein IPP78_07665 [Holophagaceae bacterium]|nr:hypothetical protein [Holophagaceae bacterium]
MTMKNPFLSGIAILLLGALLGGGAVALMHRGKPSAEATKAPAPVSYTCPMHPQIIRDQPGDCPICGMSLVPLKPESKGERKIAFYRSPMDPRQTSPTPRKDEMGMDYVAVYEDEQEASPWKAWRRCVLMPSAARCWACARSRWRKALWVARSAPRAAWWWMRRGCAR